MDYVEIIAAGGCLSNRMRFGLEVIERVRHRVGNHTVLGIRLSGHDFMPRGNRAAESAEFGAAAEKAGADCISVTGAWHETYIPQITSDVPPGAFAHLARAVRERASVPVFASNRLGDPSVAEKVLHSGAADMFCWGRPLVADPDLSRKVATGRLKERISCVTCNQGCFDSIVAGAPACRPMNPRAGREAETEIRPAGRAKRIAVAGGGPAGMEYAITAARRGHEVVLYEKCKEAGGQLNLIAALPGKTEFNDVLKRFEGRMSAAAVRVRPDTALGPETVAETDPEVVVATGARPMHLNVPGVDLPHVVDAWDLLAGSVASIGKQVVIVGGGSTGCEPALMVAKTGALGAQAFTFLAYHDADDLRKLRNLLYHTGRQITVVEAAERLADNAGPSTRWPPLKSLRRMGVRLLTKVVEINRDGVTVETRGGRELIPADTVISAVGSRPVDDLSAFIEKNKGARVVVIGDAREPRKMLDAIREGFDAALNV